MSYWIATALHDERRAVDIGESDMATSLGVDWRTIRRLETGATMGRDIDRAVAAYAHVLGLDDGRSLWRRALDRWQREGAPPQFQPIEGPAAAFVEAIRIEALRRRRDGAGTSGKRRASR